MTERQPPAIILASASASRRRMLEAAGVGFEVVPSTVDEPALRRSLEAGGATPTPNEVAMALAEAKAREISSGHPDALVIGCDQVLALGERILEKPPDMAAARRQLEDLRGRKHALISAVVLARAGEIHWRHAEAATMAVRAFGGAFLDAYLARAGDVVCQSVGAYQLEGLGAQLFEAIEGDYFTILGLPLIALLNALRAREVLTT